VTTRTNMLGRRNFVNIFFHHNIKKMVFSVK